MKATDKGKVILFLFVQGMTKAELIDAITASAKLTKADAGRLIKVYEGMPSKIDAVRMIASMSKKELFDFLFGMKKTVLIDAISAGAMLSKADAGRALNATIESIHKALNKKLKVVFGGKGQRLINADAKLKTVFGGKGQISMYELAKILSKHLK